MSFCSALCFIFFKVILSVKYNFSEVRCILAELMLSNCRHIRIASHKHYAPLWQQSFEVVVYAFYWIFVVDDEKLASFAVCVDGDW